MRSQRSQDRQSRPDCIGNASGHRSCHGEGFMNVRKIIVHEMKRDRSFENSPALY